MSDANFKPDQGLTSERANHFFKMGLYEEANYIADRIVDKAVSLLSQDRVKEAHDLVNGLVSHDYQILHLNYVKALCLIDEKKFIESKKFLEKELKISAGNLEVENLLKEVNQELSGSLDDVLLIGPIGEASLKEAINRIKSSANRILHILIDSSKEDGRTMGQFEKLCNDAISAQDAWGCCKLYRGDIEKSLLSYNEHFKCIAEVVLRNDISNSQFTKSKLTSAFPNARIELLDN